MVVSVLLTWMRDYFDVDWRGKDDLKGAFMSFLEILSTSPNPNFRILSKQLQDEYASLSQRVSSSIQSPITVTPLQWSDMEEWQKSLDQYDEDQIADTLTLYFYHIFQNIQERDYLDWLKGEKKTNGSDYIQQLVDLFNRVSAWTSKEIVTVMKLSKRVEVFEKLVGVAGRLFQCNNFIGAKAVILGVTSSFILRMEKTFKSLSQDTIAKLNELEKAFSSEKNYKYYRRLLEDAAPPCIPYLAVHQKDLVFLKDGNPNFLQSTLINFSKRSRTAEIIFDLSFCQIGSYQNNPPR